MSSAASSAPTRFERLAARVLGSLDWYVSLFVIAVVAIKVISLPVAVGVLVLLVGLTQITRTMALAESGRGNREAISKGARTLARIEISATCLALVVSIALAPVGLILTALVVAATGIELLSSTWVTDIIERQTAVLDHEIAQLENETH